MSLLETIRAEYEAAGLKTADVEGEPGFQTLCPVCRQYALVRVPSGDIRELAVWCRTGCDRSRVADELDRLRRLAEPGRPSPGRHAVITRASQVRIRSVVFLWRPWLPLGKVTLLAGAPGQGKSQLTAFFAAMTTIAGFDPTNVTEPGNAVILTAEDDLDDTVVPRLIAAGADLERVEFIDMRRTLPSGITADGLIKLPGDLETLHERLKHGDVRLVVFDPVASFIGREHSSYINQDVRDVLDPLVSLARAYSIAIVIVLHLNKSEAKTWAQKIAESHGFQAVARTVLVLAPDPDDEDGEEGDEKVLAATKLNLVRRVVPAVRFKVSDAVVYDNDAIPVETSRLELNGTMPVYADNLLADAVDRSARRDAIAFLMQNLAAGPVEAKPLKEAAKGLGLSWRTIEKCYREVCKPARPKAFQGPWVYELQDHLQASLEGGEEGFWKADVSESAVYPLQSGRGEGGENGHKEQGGDWKAADLEAYRRERDRRLGEGWEDE